MHRPELAEVRSRLPRVAPVALTKRGPQVRVARGVAGGGLVGRGPARESTGERRWHAGAGRSPRPSRRRSWRSGAGGDGNFDNAPARTRAPRRRPRGGSERASPCLSRAASSTAALVPIDEKLKWPGFNRPRRASPRQALRFKLEPTSGLINSPYRKP